MIKRSVHVGINTYADSPLSGCVNDAHNWDDIALRAGYTERHLLLDRDATKSNIMAALREVVTSSRFGDRILFTYSGHGTWVPDRGGDESDGRDEALCPIDYASDALILDDELQQVFEAKRFGVRVVIASDSCHSGTVARGVAHSVLAPFRRPRFIHPATFLPAEELARVERVDKAARTTPRTSAAALLAGCDDLEYSYDAYLDGIPQGAFSWAALRVLRQDPATSLGRLHRGIRERLPSSTYPQTPQLHATLWQRRWSL
jgi:uncharacterized caspase-like protein